MKVADVMVTGVLSVGPDASVREIASMMLERRISGLPVVDQEGRIVGIVSEGDLIRRPEIGTDHAPAGWLHLFLSDEERTREFVKSHGRKVREVMTQPAICVAADTPLAVVVRLMERHRVKRLPVVENGRLVGLVTRADLLRALVTRRAEAPVATSDQELRVRIDSSCATRTGRRAPSCTFRWRTASRNSGARWNPTRSWKRSSSPCASCPG